MSDFWRDLRSVLGMPMVEVIESWPIFSEVRLHAASVCRAWTHAHGCLGAAEWEAALNRMNEFRRFFEIGRLRLSEILSVDGIDPLGIMRKLLIHESAASLSRSWIRETGFVHLEVASGIHLYALWRAYESMLRPITQRLSLGLNLTRFLRIIFPFVLWFFVFALEGFRPGLWRPLVLVSLRWAAERFGFRWSKGVSILLALSIDAIIGFLQSFGQTQSFIDWAPGELHYALSWWGGLLGYEFAKSRGSSLFVSHVALSFCSWLVVLPLDLFGGHFALMTPFLSLLTVEFLVRGGYVAAIALAVGITCGGREQVGVALQWFSLGLNQAVGFICAFLSENGLVRTTDEFAGFSLGLALSLLVVATAGMGLHLKKHAITNG